jgi:hypothetical protein
MKNDKMAGKKKKMVSRRSFIGDTGKTLFFGTVVSAAIPVFLEGCKKEGDCNMLKEGEQENLYCNDNYLCFDPQGFACNPEGGFQCEIKGFSCYSVFECTPSNAFGCLPGTRFHNPTGGSGG